MSGDVLGPNADKVLENIHEVSSEVCGEKTSQVTHPNDTGVSVSSTPTGVLLAVGQKWRSTDPRAVTRPPFTITEIDEAGGCVVYLNGTRKVRVRISRMKPGSTGYELVE